MTKPNSDFYAPADGRPGRRTRVAALLPFALAALLALAFAVAAPAAVAQDPGYDQYAPTPEGGGNAPEGNGDGNSNGSTPVPNSGSDSGGTGTAGGGTDSGTGTPGTDTPGATTPGATDISGGGQGPVGNKDDRTLKQLAGDAGEQRVERQAANGVEGPQQQLSTTTPGGGSGGIGPLVWVALGAIVLWALVAGVVNYRRRRGDGEGGLARRREGHSKEQTA